MGFFSRAKAWVGKAIGTVGGVIRHIGSQTHNIARAIGTYLPYVTDAAALAATGLGAPAIGLGIEAGGKAVSGIANIVANYTQHSDAVANHFQNASNYLTTGGG
jgi:hypothetical protein